MAQEATLLEVFEGLEDWRDPRGRDYPVSTIMILLVGGLLAGRNNLMSIFRWGRGFDAQSLRRIGSPHGKAPAHSTYHYFLKTMPVDRLEAVLGVWVCGQATVDGDHIALDGKSLKGSATLDERARHLVSAFATRLAGVAGQVAVEPQDNEITAAKALLAKLPLSGRIVTGDAMFTQREVCQTIQQAGGDYLLAVRGNQPELEDGIAEAFGDPSPLGQGPAGHGGHSA